MKSLIRLGSPHSHLTSSTDFQGCGKKSHIKCTVLEGPHASAPNTNTMVEDTGLAYTRAVAATSIEQKAGYSNEKSSDIDPHSDTKTTSDPTDGAPWRWRIIALLFALSLSGASMSLAYQIPCTDLRTQLAVASPRIRSDL